MEFDHGFSEYILSACPSYCMKAALFYYLVVNDISLKIKNQYEMLKKCKEYIIFV